MRPEIPWIVGGVAVAAILGAIALRPDPVVAILLLLAAAGIFAALSANEIRARTLAAALEATNRRLVKLATIDELTQFQNRKAFERSVEGEIARARRSEGRFSVVTLRVLGLGSFAEGGAEAALQRFAACLERQTRAVDTRARLAEDAFAVILVGADPATTATILDRVRTGCGEIAVGVAHYPGDGDAPVALIRIAEERAAA